MDPYTFAEAIRAALAALALSTGAQAPEPAPEPAPVVAEAPRVAPEIPHIDLNETFIGGVEWTETAEVDGDTYSIGWIISPVSGRLVCVTAAPCESDAHYRGAIDSSYNWNTQEEN
jgi:hypothetical protein